MRGEQTMVCREVEVRAEPCDALLRLKAQDSRLEGFGLEGFGVQGFRVQGFTSCGFKGVSGFGFGLRVDG